MKTFRPFALVLLLSLALPAAGQAPQPPSAMADAALQVQIDSANTRLTRVLAAVDGKKESPFWKLLPSLMALLTVAVSSLVSYKIGLRSARIQKENAENTLKVQQHLAEKQLKATAENTIKQVRANNLLQAKITWYNELRKAFSGLFHKIVEHQQRIHELTATGKTEKEAKSAANKNENVSGLIAVMTELLMILDEAVPEEKRMRDLLVTSLYEFDDKEQVADAPTLNILAEQAKIVLKKAWNNALSEVQIPRNPG